MVRWASTAVVSLLLLGASPQQEKDEEKLAEAMLRRADALIEAKEFEQARVTFWYIAKKWPNTKTAEIANYRGGENCVIDVRKVHDTGPSENRIDVHIMADSFGYTNADQRTWLTVSKGFSIQLTDWGMFREYKNYFNCWRVSLASKEKGTSTETKKFDTALGGSTSDAGGGYWLDDTKAAAVAAKIPSNDGVWLVLIRMGGGVDSGGGSRQASAVMWSGGGTLIHEFGHSFGGLMDEYTSEPGGMPNGFRRPIGRGVNISETADPKKVPWAHWLERPEVARAAGVGVFKGGNAHEEGQWRPTPGGCTMDSAGGTFCPICRERILLNIYTRVNPIDDAAPLEESRVRLKKTGDKIALEDPDALPWVLPMQPFSHRLTVKWKVKFLGVDSTPTGESAVEKPRDPAPAKRGRTGVSLPFEGDDCKSLVRPDKKGRPLERPDFSKLKLEPGRYVVTVEVRDEVCDDKKDPETKQPVKVPWVVKDDKNLLVERATWEVVVQN